MILMKVAPYHLEKTSSYCADLLAQRISPSILTINEFEILKNYKKLVCSPQLRAIQTASLINNKLIIDGDLNEIPFSVDGLDNSNFSSTEIRKKFLKNFRNNTLLESHNSIKKRIDRIFKKYDDKTLCITHTFFMKIVLEYSKNPLLFKNIKQLNFDPSKRLFNYLDTIVIRNH